MELKSNIKVMTFGTFDIFHKGHENFFRQAREYGDCLIVVIARDETVRKVKGKYPHNDENHRLEKVEKSRLVKKAVLGSLEDKFEIIRNYRPDIICLGYDQKFFTEELESKINEFGLETEIKRLKAYKPEIYKSSKLRRNINGRA